VRMADRPLGRCVDTVVSIGALDAAAATVFVVSTVDVSSTLVVAVSALGLVVVAGCGTGGAGLVTGVRMADRPLGRCVDTAVSTDAVDAAAAIVFALSVVIEVSSTLWPAVATSCGTGGAGLVDDVRMADRPLGRRVDASVSTDAIDDAAASISSAFANVVVVVIVVGLLFGGLIGGLRDALGVLVEVDRHIGAGE